MSILLFELLGILHIIFKTFFFKASEYKLKFIFVIKNLGLHALFVYRAIPLVISWFILCYIPVIVIHGELKNFSLE